MRIRQNGGSPLSSMSIDRVVRSGTKRSMRSLCIQHGHTTYPTMRLIRRSPRLESIVVTRNIEAREYVHSRFFSCSSYRSGPTVVKDVAVLGGGITGLATAHYLSKEFKDAKITLYESKNTLGGWMKSKVMDVGNGKVIFESGPRSLRPQPPNGTLSLRLVSSDCTADFFTSSSANVLCLRLKNSG